MATLTTEQEMTITLAMKDGRGRPMPIDGQPVAASSDETVCTVEMGGQDADGHWQGLVSSVAPGSARVIIQADSDITPEGVNDVVGMLDVEVTLDPRTGERIVELTAGVPTDKAVV